MERVEGCCRAHHSIARTPCESTIEIRLIICVNICELPELDTRRVSLTVLLAPEGTHRAGRRPVRTGRSLLEAVRDHLLKPVTERKSSYDIPVRTLIREHDDWSVQCYRLSHGDDVETRRAARRRHVGHTGHRASVGFAAEAFSLYPIDERLQAHFMAWHAIHPLVGVFNRGQ